MTTWAGAIIETAGMAEFTSVASKCGVIAEPTKARWVLAECAENADRFAPRHLARKLSRELGATVIAFFVRTTESVEEIEQWERGELRRSLAYSENAGGWISDRGEPQAWEADFFEDAAARDDGEWPTSKRGSIAPFRRLCAQLDVDPDHPTARVVARRDSAYWLVVAASLSLVAATVVLGFLH